jgi:5S rRNA maturation endonuclease (ribonuclease M5)
MPKKKLDPIDQIHKLARDNGIVVLILTDEDFEGYDISKEQLKEAKELLYDHLMEDFGNAVEQTMFSMGIE